MAWLRSYSCVTAAGENYDALWSALRDGRNVSQTWPADPQVRVCLFGGARAVTSRELLLEKMGFCFQSVAKDLNRHGSFGVIFASTKGIADDFVWNEGAAEREMDPLAPLLHEFLQQSDLTPERAICVSNACSSSLAAIALAERWLTAGLEQVLILTADAVTPFVVKGFQSLKLVSPGAIKPFSFDRCGFYLGEAAASLLLEKSAKPHSLWIRPVGLDAEGSAVTRPSTSGDSVVRAALGVPELRENPPEIVFAHGTGTVINDATEDLAFGRVFEGLNPLITGTKWCIGHTLAVSGAIDLIAAAEALRRQELFCLATTDTVDPKFRGRYAVRGTSLPSEFSRIYISSLGFGGMHAGALIERPV